MDEFVVAEKYAGRSTAEVYVDLALAFVKLPVSGTRLWPGDTEEGLRQWWTDEAENREKHSLSPDQIARITKACQERVDLLRTRAKKAKSHRYRGKALI